MSARKTTRPATRNPKPKSKRSPIPDTPRSSFVQAMEEVRKQPRGQYQDVSGSWLLKAVGLAAVLAFICAWGTLCLLYWQGSWQLLYHPKAVIARTPASARLSFESVKFATTETGTPQLAGWWIPAEGAHFTVLFLHGADGNLSDTVDTLAKLNQRNLSVFAIDYRGYGQSVPAGNPSRPSEKQLRRDAEWTLTYLTVTRGIAPKQILVFGSDLGANLAAELAADHNELAGLILDSPLQDAMATVFGDPRSRLVPARWMIADRYDLDKAATALQIPSLWLFPHAANPQTEAAPSAYQSAPKEKAATWLTAPVTADPRFAETLQRWLDNLPGR